MAGDSGTSSSKKLVGLIALAVVGLVIAYAISLYRMSGAQPVGQLPERLPEAVVENTLGKESNLTDIIGGRPALVIAWATWCSPCVRELPILERLKEKIEKQRKIVLINYDGGLAEQTRPMVSKWLTANGLSFATYFDFKSSLLDGLGISSLPFAAETDENGKVTWAVMGEVDWQSRYR